VIDCLDDGILLSPMDFWFCISVIFSGLILWCYLFSWWISGIFDFLECYSVWLERCTIKSILLCLFSRKLCLWIGIVSSRNNFEWRLSGTRWSDLLFWINPLRFAKFGNESSFDSEAACLFSELTAKRFLKCQRW
jgi:hypothetical protein